MLPEEAVPVAGERVSFERERGVSAIVVSPEVAYLFVGAQSEPDPITVRQQILDMLAQAGLSISLIKLQRNGLSFAVPVEDLARTHQALSSASLQITVKPRLRVISIYGQNMRELHGVLAKIAEILNEAGVAIEQISDAHDRLICLISAERAQEVVKRIRKAFHLRAEAVRWYDSFSTVR